MTRKISVVNLPFLPKIFDPFHFHIDGSRKQSLSIDASAKAQIRGGRNNTNTINITQSGNGQVRDPGQDLIVRLRHQWLLENDGITPARMAGLEWGNGEKEWINQRLEELGSDQRLELN